MFGYDDALGIDFNLYPTKDVVFLPEVVPDPHGRPSCAVLHRSMWDFGFCRPDEFAALPEGLTDDRPGIWISYVPEEDFRRDTAALARPAGHRLVALPEYAWESLKIGAGTAPTRGRDFVFYGMADSSIGVAEPLATR